MKRRTKFVRLFCLISLGGILGGALLRGIDGAGALSYQSYQRIDFTFEPTLQLNVSGDLSIMDLVPGQGKESNIIGIEVGANVSTGALLTTTVGKNDLDGGIDSFDTTALVNGDNSFTALTSAIGDLSGFEANEWGYSYCVKAATICNSDDSSIVSDDDWVSGDFGNPVNGYGGLPLYNTGGVQLANLDGNVKRTLFFKIGAKAGNAQASGEYRNVINYTLVANVVTTTYNLNFLNGDGAIGMPNNISDVSISADVNVKLGSGQDQTTAPTKDGYTFMGWCTAQTSDDDCSGNVYKADETYPISNIGTLAGSPLTIDLYAMWKSDGD